MKTSLLFAALLGLLAAPVWAQEGPKDKKKGGDVPQGGKKEHPEGKPEGKKDHPEGKPEGKKDSLPCGKTPKDIAGEMKKKGLATSDLDQHVSGHFKKHHADGLCHCTCGHDKEGEVQKPPAKEGGEFQKPFPKEGGDHCAGKTPKHFLETKVDEKIVADHFKSTHPKGDPCHCTCGHEGDGGKPKPKEKGNNGVGNGKDPQPPGKAPVNDGPGTKPGQPGQKGDKQ